MTENSATACLLLGFPESYQQAKELAELAEFAYADIEIHSFPDGESKVTLPVELIEESKQLIFYRSLNHPNDKLLELILAAQGARNMGAKKLILVAPYMAYMRQDKAFNPGEVVSQTVIGKLLSESFNVVITVDSHLHRIKQLSEAIPTEVSTNLTAVEPMAHFLKQNIDKPFLLGPDEESRQWVEAIALYSQMDFCVATKQRRGDRDVKITLPEGNYKGRNMVLVDDMASSGQTLIQTARQLNQYQPASISVLVTHALFQGNAIKNLRDEGIKNIWSCNSISHATNAVSLMSLLAANLKTYLPG